MPAAGAGSALRVSMRLTFEHHGYEQADEREKKRKASATGKPDEISVGRRFAQPYAKARLLFDHPHSYREWNIVGQYDVPGFFYLESRFRLNPGDQPAIYTALSSVFTSANLKGSRFDRAILIRPDERSPGFPPGAKRIN